MGSVTSITVRKRLLLRPILVNEEYKWKIYNVVNIGNKYRLYRGNATLIAEVSYGEINQLLKGETLFKNGNSLKLLPRH